VNARAWRRLRQAVQVLAFLLFLSLLIYANAQRPGRFWADLFSRLDPLLMISASLAGRMILGGLVLAAITVGLTLLFGRVWCGWLCPLGTLLEWLGPRRARGGGPPEGWRAVKVLLFITILAAALLGNQTLLVLDPISIVHRTTAVALWPALRYAAVEGEATLYRFPALWGPLDAVHGAVIQPVFQGVQPVFAAVAPVALLFLALVALNWWAERFWCRYLSRLALLRREVGTACVDCGRCTQHCPTGTIDPQDGYRSDPAECLVCFDCLVECPREGIGFRWQLPRWRPARRQAYDPSRRQVLAAVGASVVGVALAGVEPIRRRQPATLLRPPGAVEAELSARCVRCGACVRVCPTQGLQPSLLEGGVQNLWTPRLVPRLGYCSFPCNVCGQVCPTGAIPELALEEKQHTVLGLARIDQNRCLPWAYDTPCVVCEEACPIADKAIRLEEVEVVVGEDVVVLQLPRVLRELCIGCGICEYQCPLGGEAAIRVFAPTILEAPGLAKAEQSSVPASGSG
jgi:MauM/NapG family ferredoxin protein